MATCTVSQPLNNASLPSQSGSSFVAKANVDFSGGDALLAVSASAWSAQPGPISMQVWLDSEPTGATLGTYATNGTMHLSLGRTYVWLKDVPAGQHTVSLETGPTTVTDPNDYVTMTLWQLGDGVEVRMARDAACPDGMSEALIEDRIRTEGGDQVLVSASSSGWLDETPWFVRGDLVLDTDSRTSVLTEVFPNNLGQHLATVPTDGVIAEPGRGQHEVTLAAGPFVKTNPSDWAHAAVVEWVDSAAAPAVLSLNPPLQNAQAQSQQGSGGTVAQTSFSSNGGTLLIRLNASAWTSQSGVPISIGAMLDGGTGSVGVLIVYANAANTHMTLVSNDLVVPNVAAGNHTLTLIGEANTITDENDRVSVLIMEFPAAS